MNKLISLAMASLLVTTTVGCGGNNAPQATDAPRTTSPQSNNSNNSATGQVLVPAGTTFTAKLQQDISTGKNRNKERFTLREHSPIGGNAALADAQVEGHLEDVVKAARGKKAKLNLVFDNIVLKDGTAVPIDAALVNTQVETKRKGQFLKNAGIILGGAAVGQFIGNKTGKKHGALAGATTATAAVLLSPGGEVVLKEGTEIKLKLNKPITAPNP